MDFVDPVARSPWRPAVGDPFGSNGARGAPDAGSLTALATRLADYIVLANDPAVPLIADDFWRLSRAHFRSVATLVERLAATDQETRAALAQLAANPSDRPAREALRAAAERLLADRRTERETRETLGRAVLDADTHILIDCFYGPPLDATAGPAEPAGAARRVGIDDLLAWADRPATAGTAAGPGPERQPPGTVRVVIPFCAPDGGPRLRNLLACLLALHDQSYDPASLTVAVVEADQRPRWRGLIEPLVDQYVFAHRSGLFNRAWTANVGVAEATDPPDMLCMLDADVLCARSFVADNAARLATGTHGAHLPYRWFLSLDGPSTDLAIRTRVAQRAADVPPDGLRGLLLREPPGGVVWTTLEAYDHIGGMDERYEGWGGEDDDFVARLGRAVKLVRFDDAVLHLDHPRPPMLRDGQRFNAHIEPGSWRPITGYGNRRRFEPTTTAAVDTAPQWSPAQPAGDRGTDDAQGGAVTTENAVTHENTVGDFTIAHPSNREGLPVVSLDQAHSPFKVLAHEDTVRRFVAGEPIRPIHMRIGIMGACNMRCNFCNFHSPNEDQFYDLFSFKDSIPTDKSITLMREFAANGGRAVTFCGSGECTIHPGYADICRAGHAAGLRIGLITNGSRLHRGNIARCVAETHTWVRIGLNAGTAETFNSITHDKEHTFENFTRSVRRLRETATDPEFRIGFNFVITQENHAEIQAAARVAREAGAHYVRFEPEFYSALGHESIGSLIERISGALQEAAELGNDQFEVSVPKLDRGPMDRVEAVEGDFERCHYSHFVTAVGADGHLYPCPQVHLNSRYRMGNVLEDGYAGVLDGGPRAEWEEANPRRTDLCKSCFYRPQNELLEWLKRGRIHLDDALASYHVEVPHTLHADFC